jgi:hypothetical protein
MVNRLKTPPPVLELVNSQLLTPPPTGGLGKRIRFANHTETTPSKRLCGLETLGEFGPTDFVEIQQFSDEDQEIDVSDVGSVKSRSSSPSTVSHNSSASSPRDKQDGFASLALALHAPEVTEPFQYMKLPLSVRNRIYGFLLVVPALICVRQNHTVYHTDKQAFLYAEHRELLPGIAFALAQVTVAGLKCRFSRFRSTNVGILRASKQVHAEAKTVMYSQNNFEITTPSLELSPPPNFKISLFPRGYQRVVTKVNIRVRAFYLVQWLVNDNGYAELKDAYRGLETLTLIFELENTKKGFGKKMVMGTDEKWVDYVKRLYQLLAMQLYSRTNVGKNIPSWLNLQVLFDGDRYDDMFDLDHVGIGVPPGNGVATIGSERAEEDALRLKMKRGLTEAFELFKK